MGQSFGRTEELQLCALILATLIANTAPRRASVTPERTASCYVAITTVVSTPAPYRIKRIVTTGVRRYDDDGNGTLSYCAPVDAARFAAAQAAVDRRLHEPPAPTTDNVEHVVIRSTSSSVVAEHLKYVVAKAAEAGDAFPGVEVLRLKGANGKDDDELPLPPLLPTLHARSACAEANVALERAAAPFHWAC